jgi:hypothetical protein
MGKKGFDTRVCLDGFGDEKNPLLPGFEPRFVQPAVQSLCTQPNVDFVIIFVEM